MTSRVFLQNFKFLGVGISLGTFPRVIIYVISYIQCHARDGFCCVRLLGLKSEISVLFPSSMPFLNIKTFRVNILHYIMYIQGFKMTLKLTAEV